MCASWHGEPTSRKVPSEHCLIASDPPHAQKLAFRAWRASFSLSERSSAAAAASQTHGGYRIPPRLRRANCPRRIQSTFGVEHLKHLFSRRICLSCNRNGSRGTKSYHPKHGLLSILKRRTWWRRSDSTTECEANIFPPLNVWSARINYGRINSFYETSKYKNYSYRIQLQNFTPSNSTWVSNQPIEKFRFADEEYSSLGGAGLRGS